MPPPTSTTNAQNVYTADTFMTPANKKNARSRSAQTSCLPYRPVNNKTDMFTDIYSSSSHLDFPVLGQTELMMHASKDRKPFQLKFRQQVYTPDSLIPRCLSAIVDDIMLVKEETQIEEDECSPPATKKQRIVDEPVKPAKYASNMLHPRPHNSNAFDY